ncbi:MAG: ribbon-helix-helix domain-containing protein [Spirochaetaceae bacterium]|nr:ribbon-helix-helix domain-containing protein [Spirochaetaceae bacterium]
MVRTQIQLPDALYEEVKRVAREREMSLAEVVRRGVEYITQVYPPLADGEPWCPPEPSDLGPFKAPEEDWRLIVNDPAPDG